MLLLQRKHTSEHVNNEINNKEKTTMDFADFIKAKRMEKGYSLRGFADKVEIAPAYMSDIEKRKRNAPTSEILERMANVLSLQEEEKNEMLDLAARDKNELAEDITDYVGSNESVRVALRKAKELNLSETEWFKIIEEMEKKRVE